MESVYARIYEPELFYAAQVPPPCRLSKEDLSKTPFKNYLAETVFCERQGDDPEQTGQTGPDGPSKRLQTDWLGRAISQDSAKLDGKGDEPLLR